MIADRFLPGKFMSLRKRLTLCCSALVVLVWIAMLATTLTALRNYSNEQMLRYARILMENFVKSSHDYLASYDYHRIRSIIKDSSYIDGLEYVAIYDDAGRLIASYPSYSSPIYEYIEKYIAPRDTPKFLQEEGPVNDSELSVFESPVYEHKTNKSIGRIRFALSKTEAFSSFNSILKDILLLGLLLVLALVCVLGLLINQVTQPMSHLAKICNNATMATLKGLERVKQNSPEMCSLVDALKAFSERVLDQERQLTEQKVHMALGEVASRVAHDIRSPLSSLKSAGELLRRHVGSNVDALEALNLLQLSGNRLENIANDLLARNRGGFEKPISIFSIHEVLDELIGELQASPSGKGTEFKKHYSSTALYVSGDKSGINRAVGNIIKNALEAMQQNPSDIPKRLVVTTTLNSPSPGLRPTSPTRGEVNTSDAIVLRIIDTGPGIPADKIPLILQGGHSEGKADGHGIGMKVVNEVVTAHNGHLDIESEVGVGTTFIITLPAILCHEDMTVTIPITDGGSIYVIDDEPSLREQWRLTLKAQGVVVKIFSCWEEFDSVRGEPVEPRNLPTFIIDYHFDNSLVDGLEIIRQLKAMGHSQFILATAEYWKPAIKEAAKELGITLCPKPLPKIVIQTLKPISGSPLPLTAQGGDDARPTSILLIDDDPAMHIAWKMKCKLWGVPNFQAFLNMEDCAKAPVEYAKIDAAFIDKNITGSSWALDKAIAHLKSSGVQKVWVASGESAKELESDPLCAAADGVVKGKMPENIAEYLN